MQVTSADTERKIMAILKVLSESPEPLGSITIARELERHGIFLSERAVRYHLRITDERNYTQPMGHDGRMLTSQGIEELKMALAPEQVGIILDKLELLAFQTTFNPTNKAGQLPINTSLFEKEQFNMALDIMSSVFKAGLCVSDLVAVAPEGEKLGSVVIPHGKIGLATICSVAVNGVLLKAGIPVQSKFGGILEVRESKPPRFTAIINYGGTSVDPNEQYIHAGMTSVREAIETGNGQILANFRELPASARSMTADVIESLKAVGINGVYALGNTSEPICQIPVRMNQVGMVLLGGLNPLAAAFEAGIAVENIGESGALSFERFTSFWNL